MVKGVVSNSVLGQLSSQYSSLWFLGTLASSWNSDAKPWRKSEVHWPNTITAICLLGSQRVKGYHKKAHGIWQLNIHILRVDYEKKPLSPRKAGAVTSVNDLQPCLTRMRWGVITCTIYSATHNVLFIRKIMLPLAGQKSRSLESANEAKTGE